MVQDIKIADICGNVVCIAFGKLEIPEEEDSDHQAKYSGHVLEFESEGSHGGSQVRHRDRVVTKWPRRKTITAGGCEQGIFRWIFEVESVSLGWGGASEELVEDVIRALFVCKAAEPRLVQAKCEHLGATKSTTLVEMELEIASVARG